MSSQMSSQAEHRTGSSAGSTRAPSPASDPGIAARFSPPPIRSGLALLAQGRRVLAEARAERQAGERFRLAHLAALRCAAALLAERARPGAARRGPTNAWVLLAAVAPELADWASYFAAGAPQRAAVEAGSISSVSEREADDLVRAVEQFLQIVESGLGLLTPALAS